MRWRRSGSCTWSGELSTHACPPPLSSRATGEGSVFLAGERSLHDRPSTTLWYRRAHDVGMPCAYGNARNLFRAGARATFFLKRKSPKKTRRADSNLPPATRPGFFDEASCLIEKRCTSCAPPSGSPFLGPSFVADRSPGRAGIGTPEHGGTTVFPDRPAEDSRRGFCRAHFSVKTSGNLTTSRLDDGSASSFCPATGDPEGGGQEVRRFSMRQGGLIEKSGPQSSRQMCIGTGKFSLVTFFAPKKVTRAPARKRFRALPAGHDSRSTGADTTGSRQRSVRVRHGRFPLPIRSDAKPIRSEA